MKKFDIINADIIQNISLSKSMAVYDGKKIIIEGGYAGQNAELKITKIKNSRLEAVIQNITKKAPFQKEPLCSAFLKCGGCRFQDITYEKQLEIKTDYIKNLFRKANLHTEKFEDIIASPSEYGYKNKMEFSFGNEVIDGPLTLGMHEKKKHYSICKTQYCHISPDDFSVILRASEDYFRSAKIPFYSQKTKKGSLRHLVMRHSIRDKDIMLNLVTSSEEIDLDGFCDMILSLKLNGQISGILHSINDAVSDTVKAESVKTLYGRNYIYERILGLDFKITSFSFFQTNTRACELLYKKVIEYAGNTAGKVIYDLYCGTGTIALTAAKGAERVIGIELNEEAIYAAKQNADMNRIKNCEFIAADVLEAADRLSSKPDIIILDPPRSGVHPKALNKIINLGAETIIYISCKASSAVSQLPLFLQNGYIIKSVCPVDMFPQTEHVETVILMSRAN